jgi:hypothetical protein
MWYRGSMVDSHAMTIRLPGPVYEALRREAFDRRVPMTEIITEALQAHMDDYFSKHPKA